jgi:hypothetical protein
MKTRYILYPPLCGLAAAALMLIAIQTSGTGADWIQANLFLPGRLATAALFSKAAVESTSPLPHLVEYGLNFVFTWIGLVLTIFFLDKLAGTLYELTKA